MVDLFAAAALRTDREHLDARGTGALPPRILDDGDTLGDFSRAERGTVRRVVALGDQPEWQWVTSARVWRRMMRAPSARADMEAILAAVFGVGRSVWPGRLRAVGYAVLPLPVLEAVSARTARSGSDRGG